MENTGTPTATPQAEQAPATPNVEGAKAGNPPVEGSGNPVKDAAAEARRKLKIDNEEVDEDEVLKVYKARKSHQQAANKELQEGKKAKKQAEEFISMMKDKGKLFDTIKKLGHDPRKLAEEYLAAQLEDEMMDPKEKELKEYRAKLQTYEEREKAEKEAKEKAETDKLKAKYAEDYSAQFIEALKTEDLPATKEMVASMAKYIARAAAIKFPMTALEAAKLVKEDEDLRIKHRLKNATPEQMMKILDEEGLQKIRTYDTSRLKDPNSQLKTPSEQGEISRKRDNSRRMTPQEWRAFNRK